MSAAVNDSEEYYCFRVKESVDSELGVDDENIVIPCSYNFDLEKLRTELVSFLVLRQTSTVDPGLTPPRYTFARSDSL